MLHDGGHAVRTGAASQCSAGQSAPIGSVIDFGSFFIAEIVISVSLIASVMIGHYFEWANEQSSST